MMYMIPTTVLLVAAGLLFFSANALLDNYVTSASWGGAVVYISVKREAVQKKLDLFHSAVSNECGDGPELFLPEADVLPGLDDDQYPVYIDAGLLTSHDFEDYLAGNPDPCIEVSGLEVAVTIPFLSTNSTGPPVYALALAKFYERSRGNFPKTNFLYPYIPVDEIKMSDDGVVVRNGTDEMRISFNRLNYPCKPPSRLVSNEFDGFVLGEFQFGLPKPDFSFCDRHSFESDYCTNAARVRCGAHRYAPNVCQIWESGNQKSCFATVEIQNITSGFRDFILLGDDPINVLASETFSGDYTVGLKYPCQE